VSEPYDAVIIGAGPGGAATAHYLALAGLRVLLLDKFSFPRDKTCGDALTPRALRILDEMGLLERIQRESARHDLVRFTTPNGREVNTDIPVRDARYSHVEILPRLELDNLILERAIASGATFEGPVRVTNITRNRDDVTVTAERGKHTTSYAARMAVIATGANTALLTKIGFLKRQPAVMLACRAYYEGISDLPEGIQCRFDGLPMPGYGWVFPVSPTRANIGAGIFRSGLAGYWMPNSARGVFDRWLQMPLMQRLLAGAWQDGLVRGYPIRVDFATAPTYGERIILVGEAAGLVNPVTGEGIDYALESGKLAAEHLTAMFADGDFSTKRLRAYDAQLRAAYQRLFTLCDRMRLFYGNPLVINRALEAMRSRRELRHLYMNIVMENDDAVQALSARTLATIAFGGSCRLRHWTHLPIVRRR
jgi:geranylgeranyl reductase family protein